MAPTLPLRLRSSGRIHRRNLLASSEEIHSWGRGARDGGILVQRRPARLCFVHSLRHHASDEEFLCVFRGAAGGDYSAEGAIDLVAEGGV